MRLMPVLAALTSVGCLLSGTAQAAVLEISPVTISLADGQSATTIEVRNRGNTPAAVQVRAYAWAQAGDEDVLTPTRDLILSPPIFTVPAGGSQTLRLLSRGGTAGAGERSYRLLLDEVPAANPRDQQIIIAMRASLPVIVAGAAPSPNGLQWRVDHAPGGEIVLSATNAGRGYDAVQAIAVTLADGSRRSAVARGKNPYVLAGAERHWVVDGGRVPAGALRLNVTTRNGKSEQTLALAP
ncbi:fimbria/pilus periplasmic chaperone [Phenylobacterium sp. LjRoot225]|uniref:fimbrial biogenesis chaperone n=1 Tax=Phenylobacterium sp. LjRoot225 TaxID=3342285 RepID=UPI003ECD808E